MAGVQLARAGRPEAFARVRGRPDVEVADLRAFRGRDADDGARRGFPGFAGARGEGEGCQGWFAGCGGDSRVEVFGRVEDGAWEGLVRWLGFGASWGRGHFCVRMGVGVGCGVFLSCAVFERGLFCFFVGEICCFGCVG